MHIRSIVKEYGVWLHDRALEVGIITGHFDYQRFIILGRSRAGSNFLLRLLDSHRQVVVFEELFANHESVPWNHLVNRGLRLEKILRLRESDPIRFLDTMVFRKYPEDVLAVGFKIFYYHARDDRWKCVWEYLSNIQDLKVIHIKRKNILKTHLSWKIANQTENWVSTAGVDAVNELSITLDYEECLHAFETTRAAEEERDRFFENHQKIDVVYEDLARDYLSEMERVQEFLGLASEMLYPSTYKQNRLPPSKAIANYAALKERFEDTPWLEFFED